MIEIIFQGKSFQLNPGDQLDLCGFGLIEFHTEQEAVPIRETIKLRQAEIQRVVEFVANKYCPKCPRCMLHLAMPRLFCQNCMEGYSLEQATTR